MNEKIAVLGLGYVGLPIALALAEKFSGVRGYDVNKERINELKQRIDITQEVTPEVLEKSSLEVTFTLDDLKETTFFIVTVPTPIDKNKQPDLRILMEASKMIGQILQKGSVVVYESTVYPGVTEEVCGPILEKISGLKQGEDFKLGYSPERINPGDKEHTIDRVIKVVAGEDSETLDRISHVYEQIISAGIHRAPSIKVAEAAKVIENTQRDLNIALMNELSLIFDCMNIRTEDVLAAARTKWNFLDFRPGLVGGHCIGVDPYYLTAKAENLGYHPQVILAGRRINDNMGKYIAQRMVKMLIESDTSFKNARVGILGLTFKENVPDLRNSRVPDIVTELRQFGIEPLVHDPLASNEEAQKEYNISLSPWENVQDLDGVILAVSHRFYLEQPSFDFLQCLRRGGVFIDVKSAISPQDICGRDFRYWSL